MSDHFSPTGAPLLVGSLIVTSTTSDSITVSWTAPQPTPTGYTLTHVCMLLCGDPLPTPSTPTTATGSSTSATVSSIPPGSECNITLTAQNGSASSNELMVTATTLSESKQTISVHVLLCLTWTSCGLFCDKQNHQQHPLALLLCQ